VEWTTAAFNTLDDGNTNDNCWSRDTNLHLLGRDISVPAPEDYWRCLSSFGTYNQIGNAGEFTDEVTVGGSRSASDDWWRLVGTPQATEFPSSGTGAIPPVILSTLASDPASFVTTFDLLTGFPSGVGIGAIAPAASGFSSGTVTAGPPAGGAGGANWAAVRGWGFDAGNGGGRRRIDLGESPLNATENHSGRCSILPP
jgi:hypothetical protein